MYRHIAAQDPAIVRKPQNPFAELPRARSGREGRGNALRSWPEMLGVGISFDEHDTPHFTFEKDTFSLSEAVSYFEYTLDAAIRAQRGQRPQEEIKIHMLRYMTSFDVQWFSDKRRGL